MTSFCSSPLWDTELTWYSSYPQFTSCFENTVLACIPASVLVVSQVLSRCSGRKRYSSRSRQPWTTLPVLRLVLSLALVLAYICSLLYKFVTTVPSCSSTTADQIYAATFAGSLILQERHRRNGVGSSMLLLFFWFVAAICHLPECLRRFEQVIWTENSSEYQFRIDDGVRIGSYPVILVQLVLSSWTNIQHDPKKPYLSAGPISSILFGWMAPLIWKGYRNSLKVIDLFALRSDLTSIRKHQAWKHCWDQELEAAGYDARKGSLDSSRRQPSLFRSLRRAFWKPIALASMFALMRALVRTVPALMLHLITGYMSGKDPYWKGVLYALAIVSAHFTRVLLVRQIDCALSFAGLGMKAAIVGAVYRKALRISSESREAYTVGDMVNFVSVDADRIFRLCSTFGFVVAGPSLILITLVLLWQYLGAACLAGVAVMVVIMSTVALVMNLGHKYQASQMKLKDKRLKSMAEILSGIKVVKLLAWENPFMQNIEGLRVQEMGLLKKYSFMTAFSYICLTCSSVLVAFVSFVTYVLMNENNSLDPTTAFVSLTLFNQMRYAMFAVPDFISNAIQTSVSLQRIEKFLLSSEISESSVGQNLREGNAITIKNATLSWSWEKEPVLHDLELSVKRGQLTAIVGPVGSGKSSLLSALLGDLQIRSGSVDCLDSIAYVPQCPWIQNKTLRDNVLFTKGYDAALYNDVLRACSLERDLEVFPRGDLTEIGEKGINLSGGQKQRVSLARAAYQAKDLYLFDDPLSAVDAHVGASIFRRLMGPNGMLRTTTRILVTHNLSVLPDVDNIVVIKEGRVVESGTYQDLKKEGSVLSELLSVFVKNSQNVPDDNEPIIDVQYSLGNPKNELGPQLVQKETILEGSISARVYASYLKRAGPLLLLAVLFCAAYQAVDVYNAIWMKAWTGDAAKVDRRQDVSLRNYRIQIYALLCFCHATASFVGIWMLWSVALTASTRLHHMMLHGVMRSPLSFFDTTPSGRLLNRFGKDVDQMDVQLPKVAYYTLRFLLQILAMVVLNSVNLPYYILVAVPVFVCFVGFRQVYVKPFRQVKRLESVTRSPVNNHLSETVAGLTSIRSYGVQRIFVEDNDRKMDETHTCAMNAVYCKCWMQVCVEVMSDVLIFSVLLFVISNRENIGPAMAGLLISYSINTLAPLNQLIYHSAELEATLVSAERLDEYSRLAPEAPWDLDRRLNPSWPTEGAVSFQSYATRYRDGLDLVLKGVTLDVRPGEKIGLVGRTGAGKSTVTLALFRIVEAAEGRIVVDGVDIASLGLHDLRSRFTVIPQEPVLFRGSLRYNLDPTGEHADDKLWTALERAHLKGTFKDVGLDFEISEGGSNISAGQRQLVCIARAVLRKTKILVLDEATASIDMETDALVQQTLGEIMTDCTVVTVAHRLHTVLRSDRIVVMDGGKILEVGTPAELLRDDRSAFYSLALEAGLVPGGKNESGGEHQNYGKGTMTSL